VNQKTTTASRTTPSRTKPILATSPAERARTAQPRASVVSTDRPSNAVILSPACNPARAAGDPQTTESTPTPIASPVGPVTVSISTPSVAGMVAQAVGGRVAVGVGGASATACLIHRQLTSRSVPPRPG
jgi:hypothetical protein